MFPDVNNATPDGLVAIGGDLSQETLLAAYQRGIYPWYSAKNPILWWSPDPRGIIPLDGLHVGKTLRKILKRQSFEIKFNTVFEDVMRACAVRGEDTDSGWITPEMIEAYVKLNRIGHAHSIEVWQNEKLSGGLYGIAIRGLFAGESMFFRKPNASKIALVALVEHLNSRGYTLLDCQMITEVTSNMGAIEISRDEYLKRLKHALNQNCTFDS